MDELKIRPIFRPIDRTLCLPGSKSLTNRALVIAALASGASELEGVLFADDTRHMMDALQALGVEVHADAERRLVNIRGAGGQWLESCADLFCGNAGTVLRFLAAVCCAGSGEYRLDGAPRMRERPIGDLVDGLRQLGANIEYEGSDGHCPLIVRTRGLSGGRIDINHPSSSQFVSALLIAAPTAANDVFIQVQGELPSVPYVRMTLEAMAAFGASAIEDDMRSFIVPAPQQYTATHYAVEPDATAASYFFGAAALTGGRITVDGLGRNSVQGDCAFVEVLEKMGCRFERTDHNTTVWGPEDGRLSGVDVDLNDMPDVAQTLAVIAAFAESPTTIRNVGNLRVKETDRLAALGAELARLGVEVVVREDGITVEPVEKMSAAAIHTYDDHRMAMSFALAGLRLEGVSIRNPQCVNKTFPEFFELWSDLAN